MARLGTGPGQRVMVFRGVLMAALLMAVGLMTFAASASAAVNITGTWSCCGGVSTSHAGDQTWVISDTNGTLTGQVNGPNGPGVANITGTDDDGDVTIVTTYPGTPAMGNQTYAATFKGTVAGNGESMSGTWK